MFFFLEMSVKKYFSYTKGIITAFPNGKMPSSTIGTSLARFRVN